MSTLILFMLQILLQPLQMHPRRLHVIKSITVLPMRERQIAREPGAGGDAVATDDKADGEFYVFEQKLRVCSPCAPRLVFLERDVVFAFLCLSDLLRRLGLLDRRRGIARPAVALKPFAALGTEKPTLDGIEAMVRIRLPRFFSDLGKGRLSDKVAGIDVDFFTGNDCLANAGKELIDFPRGLWRKDQMIPNLRPKGAVWQHYPANEFNHFVPGLAAFLNGVFDLDSVNTGLDKVFAALLWFALFVCWHLLLLLLFVCLAEYFNRLSALNGRFVWFHADFGAEGSIIFAAHLSAHMGKNLQRIALF